MDGDGANHPRKMGIPSQPLEHDNDDMGWGKDEA